MEGALGERRGKAPRPPHTPRPRRSRASGMEAEWPRRRSIGGSGRSQRTRPRKGDAPPANIQKARSLCGDKNPDLSARSLDCVVDDLPQTSQELTGFVAHHRAGYWSGTVVNPINIVGPMSG